MRKKNSGILRARVNAAAPLPPPPKVYACGCSPEAMRFCEVGNALLDISYVAFKRYKALSPYYSTKADREKYHQLHQHARQSYLHHLEKNDH
jgi:hypothetical protein